MKNRLNLQSTLETICPNVYYQKPTNTKMRIPAIVYSRNNIADKYADDGRYSSTSKYTVTVIDKDPDSIICVMLLGLKYCSYDKQYIVDGLYHTTFNLYY